MGLVKVASFANRVEAGIAAGILESRGIPCTIRSDDVGIFGPGHVGGSVLGADLLTAEPFLAQALELLEDAGLLD